MRMRIRGIEVNVERQDVERIAREALKANGKTRYVVIVKGRAFPAKRLFHELLKSKGLSLTLQDITTKDAVYAFRRLGFEVVDKGEAGSLLELAGSLSIGGNAVEDERRLYSS
jgi:hypothetical protein